MARIGIDLNHVVRNINKQIVKYYKKDIDRAFDDDKLDLNVVNIMKDLNFKSKKEESKFLFEDYPFEVFGSAPMMDRDLSVKINKLIVDLADKESNHTISFFSTKEKGLSIQSSYFFLSKIGSRVREVFFPKSYKEAWEKFDMIITSDIALVDEKPEGKEVILVKKNDTTANKKCYLVVPSLSDLLDLGMGWMDVVSYEKLSWNQKLKFKLFHKI